MMANHMEEVAKMLGVEIGEEFNLSRYDDTYRITKRGLEFTLDNRTWIMSSYLTDILTGFAAVIKKPWKPKFGGSYWSVMADGHVGEFMFVRSTMSVVYYKIGNCYRTEAEAMSNVERWKAWYSSDEIVDVFNG